MTNNDLMLIDGSNYFYRAFHAMSSLSNSKGVPTGAVYGMMGMLKSLLAEYQPQYAAVVFDVKGKNFRHKLYPDYKANRQPMPETLFMQIPHTHQMVQALGFPLLMVEGVEADDVIGTLAKQAEAANLRTLIFSGDKDFAQLVSQSIILFDRMKNQRLDVQGVIKKFGIPPKLIVDYLSLVGDNADNVPGVKKVGPKTALKWLKHYGSLDMLIKSAWKFTGRVGENLHEALPHLPLTRELLTIKCDVPLSSTPEQLILKPQDINQLRQLYIELEFKTELVALPRDLFTPSVSVDTVEDADEKVDKKQYHTVTTPSDFELWLNRLSEAEMFAFDTETTSLDYLQAEIVGVSFAVQPFEAAYVPLTHDYLGVAKQLSRDEVLAALKPLLENPDKAICGHNLKYDAHVLANHGIELQGIAFDTMLESYVLDSTATRHDMDSLALQYLGLQTITFKEIAGRGKKQLTFNQIDLEKAGPYACEDADVTLQLHEKCYPQVQALPGGDRIFTEIEMPLFPVLMRMERNGVTLDAVLLHEQSKGLQKSLHSIEQEAYNLVGYEFNLNSPKQLQTILFDELQLPVLKKTPKKEPSTAVEVLEELAARDYPLPQLILEYRSLSKLKSTYTDALPQEINPKTGRVHTSYQQAVTATGRLSSTNPNLQNIPIRSEEGRRIRQAFIVPKGFRLLAADYSQIELRIMAHLSEDEKLLSAFAAGEDIHKMIAAEVFEVPLDEVTSEQRRSAKAVNFGLIYGMQAFGLGKQLGIKRTQAQSYIETYFARYPGVQTYMAETRELAKKQGYVETVFGRRLSIPEINSSNHQRRQYAERTAINAPMQGTAADLIKMAMLKVDEWIRRSGLGVKMLMQVHDELVFEVPEACVEAAQVAIIDAMTQVAQLRVPLLVDVGVGKNWDEAH